MIDISGPITLLKIDGCYFEGGASAIDAQNVVGVSITDSYFNAFLVHEIILTGGTQNVQVSDNYFTAITQRAVSVSGTGHVLGTNTFSRE